MRYFIGTEFHEEPGILDLISLGIVAEDGREWYGIRQGFDSSRCNPWVRDHVLPNLCDPRTTDPGHDGKTWWYPRVEMKAKVLEFVGTDKPEFWGYYSDYDWVAFCQVFGCMIDLPKGWPMFCLDIRQEMHRLGIERARLPPEPTSAHNALVDARWTRDAFAKVGFGPTRPREPETPLVDRPRNADDMGMPPL